MSKKLAISVNGGGALGIGPLTLMSLIEKDLGIDLSEKCSAFGGTSTGAIIASCLDEGMSATKTEQLFRENVKRIFTKYPWYKRLIPSVPKYNNSNLKELLKANLVGKMGDYKKPIYIPTTFMNGDSVEKVWDLGDIDVEKWFAVLTSTAAPTYFDVVVDDGKSYCDGGMWANDPIMTLEAGLTNSGWHDYKILSFNTSLDTPNTASGNMGLFGWAKYILNDWVARSGKSNFYEARANLGYENVMRLSPKCDNDIAMDSTSDKSTHKIVDIWDNYYNENKKEILGFINECL